MSVTKLEFHNPKIQDAKTRIRIVHISDLHIGGRMRVLDKIPGEVARLDPDYIVLTGDYLTNKSAGPVFLDFLKKLKARRGKYAVFGNWEQRIAPSEQLGLADFDVIDRRIVRQQAGGARLVFSGFNTHEQAAYLRSPESEKTINIVLYHYPDLINYAASENVDYYFCGHTHGGQVRIPFYGAFFTLSRYGKRFEMGLYRVHKTTMYVTRGIGLEGATPIKMRFLCPPEIVVYDIMK